MRIFQIILAIAVSWALCAIITVAGGFPSDPMNPQYKARTDARIAVLKEAEWLRFPYPGGENFLTRLCAWIMRSSHHQARELAKLLHLALEKRA